MEARMAEAVIDVQKNKLDTRRAGILQKSCANNGIAGGFILTAAAHN